MKPFKLEDLISNNKDIFKEQLKEVIKPTFDGLDNPKKYSKTLDSIIKDSKRMAFPRQARLVSAAAEYLLGKKNKSLLISSEMGTGKTDMAIKIAMACKNKFKVNFVMCPPHLVDKWEEEIDKNFKDKDSYKVVKISHFTELVPYSKRNLKKDAIQYFFIVSRETAKLSYPKFSVWKEKKKLIKKYIKNDNDKNILVNDIEIDILCPECNTNLIYVSDEERMEKSFNKDDINANGIKKLAYKCHNCKTVLRDIERKSPTSFKKSFSNKEKIIRSGIENRLSIAEYIKRSWKKGVIDFLIVDEIHECATC